MFKVGQKALEALQVIVEDQKIVSNIKLKEHEVEVNWRQLNKTISSKEENLLKGFEHTEPIRLIDYPRKDFLKLKYSDLPKLTKNRAWSIISKVECSDGEERHLPLMNFHPEDVSVDFITKCINYICGKKSGVLLSSGRFYHYYGNFLLDETDWIKFMSEFLMPVIIVSPRYIGHRLFDGYCALRITSDDDFKPKVPEVIKILNNKTS